jgi:hypothetical protein
MPVYLVTGKLGSGKSLATVGRIKDYLNQGRPVATNLDLYLEKLINPFAENSVAYRLPDKPALEDLEALPSPLADGEYDESKTGLIVLDECGTWFNTRSFTDKTRLPLINKLLHIRKCGWDVMFIVQHIEMIDKQVREGLGEHVVYCQRADRLGIPFITGFSKIFGLSIRPPKIHLALVKYGTSSLSPVVDRWIYNGSDLYDAYDTRQIFGASDCGINSLLPPQTVFGRYTSQKEIFNEQFKKRYNSILQAIPKATRLFFLTGLAIGYVLNSFLMPVDAKPDPIVDIVVESPDSNPDDINQESEQSIDPLLNVRITASEKLLNGFTYYFWDDVSEQSFNVESIGYSVRWIDYCTARLVSTSDTRIITCES